MGTVRVSVPGAAAEGRDVFRQVEIRPDGSPFRFVFRYMEAVEETGERSLVCVETAIELPVNDPRDLEGRDDVPALTPTVLSDWKRLEEIARANLAGLLGGTGAGALPPGEPTTATATLPRRKRLSVEFLSEIASRYREHVAAGVPPTQTLMREERVSRRTVGNWLKAAREAGLLGAASPGRAGEETR